MTLVDREERVVQVPLKEVRVSGKVNGLVGEFTVHQTYEHQGTGNVEVVYTFPLPDNAVVSGFTAKVGERKVRSEIRGREEAFKVYDEAVRKGDTAFLVEQFRPNIFQISLGQLQSGDRVEIELSYLQEMQFMDGELRITVPTVVAPRYIPGVPGGTRRGMGEAEPTDRVPDADFITPPLGDADYTFALALVVEPPKPADEYLSPSHSIKVESLGGGRSRITLAKAGPFSPAGRSSRREWSAPPG